MMQRILNNRQGIILGITGLFLLILAFYMLAIKPKVELWNTQESEISSLNQQNALLQSKIDERDQESQDDSLTEEAIAAALPPNADAEQLILDIKQIGEQASVRLSDAAFAYGGESDATAGTSISQVLSANGLNTVYVTVNVEGNYTQLRTWIDLVQKTDRVTTVDSIAFQQPAQPNTLLAATITFTASYLPSTAVADPAATDAAVDPAP
ncbi:type II secretion system protein GspM [Saccharibacillus qingshengii]|uniref:type II secretion system protein GspM n=1 Tax=Saccharibacillus qingshengii TaxID=1763540 RepID=UPI0015559241|nr:type II secretion system protein GspM [Saccharibacillus qingshengii]